MSKTRNQTGTAAKAPPAKAPAESAADPRTESGSGTDLMVADADRQAEHEAARSGSGAAPSPRKTTAAKMVGVRVKPLEQAVKLTDDQGKEHVYPAGTTRMPAAHAEHWYCKAHNVQLDADGED